jgi:hypothetical protein
MNDQPRDAARAIDSEITPINSIDHQDVTPLTTNKSSDNVDRHLLNQVTKILPISA